MKVVSIFGDARHSTPQGFTPEDISAQKRAYEATGGKVEVVESGRRLVQTPPADFDRARKRALAKIAPSRKPTDPEPPEAA